MKQHGLHAAIVRQVHAGLGLPYILLCSIQPRLVDDLIDKALWLEELVVSQGSEALKLLLVLGVHVNLYKGGHTRPKEARINFFPISWEPRDIHIDFLIAVILQQLSVEGALLLALFSACAPSRRQGRWLTSHVGSSLSSEALKGEE